MSNYHTQALADADIFTIMGSIYAEVARYDSAIAAGQLEQAGQATSRALEIVNFAPKLKQLNDAQKQEIEVFRDVFLLKTKAAKQTGLDDYLMPFAVAARRRQLA